MVFNTVTGVSPPLVRTPFLPNNSGVLGDRNHLHLSVAPSSGMCDSFLEGGILTRISFSSLGLLNMDILVLQGNLGS